jgi:hypothetical protein
MAKKSNTLNDLSKFLEFENIQFSGGSVMKSEDEFLSKTPVSFVTITSKEEAKPVTKTEKSTVVPTAKSATSVSSIETTLKDIYMTAVQPYDQFGVLKLTIEFQTTVFSAWVDFQRKLWLKK